VQLLAVFALLYLWEGLLFGIPGAVLFLPARGGFRARRCDGPALLPLRPGRIALLAAPLPFRIGAEGVVSDVALRRFGTRDLTTRARSFRRAGRRRGEAFDAARRQSRSAQLPPSTPRRVPRDSQRPAARPATASPRLAMERAPATSPRCIAG
jgi:hypothetical protein